MIEMFLSRSKNFSAAALVCLALPVMAAPDPVRFGGFTQTATFSVASQLGFFNHNDLNVTFLQIPNSTFGYAQILNGGYDFLTGTIDDAVNFRFNSNENLTVLGQLDAGPDLTIASVHNITSILQLKGKSLMVDSPVSGYAYMLRKVLSLYGLNLENGDYIFQVRGNS
jgi:ABC-type nitrate/sulfonate/bicarbonate transport system substrate-binding protein